MKTVSPESLRAIRWQRKQVAMGNCRLCGKPRKTHALLCNHHHVRKSVARKRERDVDGID